MDNSINCVPFPLNWTNDRMSLKVDIILQNPISKHAKIIGEASVVLVREDVSDNLLKTDYVIDLIYTKISWFEYLEEFDVTDEDLLRECEDVAGTIWDE